MLVNSYTDRPKMLLVTQTTISDTVSTSFELLNNRERALAYPGQVAEAATAANMIRSMNAKFIEFEMMAALFDGQSISGVATVLGAIEQDIELVAITSNTLAALNVLPISEEARGRIMAAVSSGKSVLVPGQMVMVDGQSTIGWLEIDPTGYTSFVTEDGRHALTAVENAALIGAFGAMFAAFIGALGAMLAATIAAVGAIIAAAITVRGFSGSRGDGFDSTQFTEQLPVTGEQMPFTKIVLAMAAGVRSARVQCDSACAEIEELLVAMGIAGAFVSPQTPLPPAWLGGLPLTADSPDSIASLFASPTTAGTNLTVNATTGLAAFNGLSGLDWSSSAAHAFAFDNLTATNASVYESDGTLLGTGTASATSSRPAAVVGSNLMADISGSGSAGFYAAAAAGLGTGNNWQSYSADLTATQPYTVTLEKSTVIVGGNTFTGSLYLVVNGTTSLDGSGPAGAANFAAATSLQTQNGGLMLGPAAGTFQVNGQPVDVSNGVAVGGYSGPITVAEAGATTDLVTFTGTADFFTLALSPATSTTGPNSAVIFDAEVESNFSDVYTLTVDAPNGWTTTIDTNGQVTAVPSVGAAPDDYFLLVAVQSGDYPDLFASAVHTVTITAVEDMEMAVSEDGAITVPMGEVLNDDNSDPGTCRSRSTIFAYR
jgi:hypothetical protein